jgi:phosphate transport system substrate-binding protein
MKYRKSLILLFILILFSGNARADDPLSGPAFTDPADIFKMPPEWEKQPIKYEEWAGNADISVTLEQDVYQMLLPLIRKFEKDKGLKVAVKEGTCGISAGMLSRKVVDIGGYCCPPAREDRLPGLKFHTLGIVAKAFLVHPENAVENVSAGELRNIFQGKLRRWSELKTRENRAGPALPIKPIGRFHCPLRPGHWRLLLENEDLFSTGLNEVGSMPDMIAAVATNKGAIGWETLGMAEHHSKMGVVKPLKINGRSPTDGAALAEGKYPFYRTYGITTWEVKGAENPNAKELVDYLLAAFEDIDPVRFGVAPASKLKKAGWKFREGELVGEPNLR